MVPDDGAGMINNSLVRHQKPPTKIDIVACRAVLGVEKSDCLKGLLPKRHVTARDVLGVLVVHQHTCRIAWRLIYTLGSEVVLRRREIGPADGRGVMLLQRRHHVVEPVWIREGKSR